MKILLMLLLLTACVPKKLEMVVKTDDRASEIETRFHMLCLDLVYQGLNKIVDDHCVPAVEEE